MIFEITHEHHDEHYVNSAFNPLDYDKVPEHNSYTWALVKSDGEHIAHGPRVFYDEKECRSQIAAAKKAMKGAMRCKVVTRS